MKRGRKTNQSKPGQRQPPNTARNGGSSGKKVVLPKLSNQQQRKDATTQATAAEDVLLGRSDNNLLPEIGSIEKKIQNSERKVIHGSKQPVQLRLRTPSPERRRRIVELIDNADEDSKVNMSTVMDDLTELRNTRNKMAEREKLKYENRFTELPQPVYNPPPKGMPENNEIVQRVLDRRAVGIAAVLHPNCHKLKFDMRLLRIAYDSPSEVGIQAGGWGFGENVSPDMFDSDSSVGDREDDEGGGEEETNAEVAMALESVADSLLGVAQNLIDSVYLNDSWRFFRRTGGNGVEWTHQEAMNRRKRLPNPFRCLVLPAWHVAGDWCPTLDFTKFDIDDDMVLLAMQTNPKFVNLNLKGCVTISASTIRAGLACRGKGLLSLDLSNGVRSCGDIFKPLNFQASNDPARSLSNAKLNNKNNNSSDVVSQVMLEEDEQVSQSLGSIIILSLNRCPGLSASLIGFVALRCKALMELDLSYNTDNAVNDLGLRWMAAACQQIRKLKIDRSSAVTDVGMRALVTRCTQLTHLHASYCPLIFGKFLLVEPAHEKAPSRVVVKCRQLQLIDFSYCEELEPFFLSWAGSSASRLRNVNVKGTPAASQGAALFALCHCTRGMERLVIDSAKPIPHKRTTTMDYGSDQEEGPCAAEAPRTFGNRSRPLSSHLLVTALGELNFGRGLLELECDDITDKDLVTLLRQQGKILRVLRFKKVIHLKGHAFGVFVDEVTAKGEASMDEMAYQCVHKKRMVDRHGEELPNVHLDYVLGELQTLELGFAHRLAPAAFRYLTQLQLPNLHTLSVSGLRGGARKFAPALSGFIKEVGPHLESLTLQDMIIDDTIATAIAEGCRPRIAYASAAASLGAASAGSGGSGATGGLFGGLFGGQPAVKPTKKRQYTTVDDLPKLRKLVLEYIRSPKKAKEEELKDRPKKKKSHLTRSSRHSASGDENGISLYPPAPQSELASSVISSNEEGSDLGVGSPGMMSFGGDGFKSSRTSIHEGDAMEPMSAHSLGYHGSDGSFSDYGRDSDSASDVSGMVKHAKGPGTSATRSVRSGSIVSSTTAASRFCGMTDAGLGAIVTSVGSCLTSFQLLGFNGVTGLKVFDLAGAVGVEGTGKTGSRRRRGGGGGGGGGGRGGRRRKSSIKANNRGSFHGYDSGFSGGYDDGFYTGGSQSPGGDGSLYGSGFSTRAGSVEATPLRANSLVSSLAVSRAVTRPGSAKKSVSLQLVISPHSEPRSPKPDHYMSPTRFSGMPAGILKTSSNIVLPSMGSRMEFANRQAQEEYMENKQAEEQEAQAAVLRTFSVSHAPGFFKCPFLPKKIKAKTDHDEDGSSSHRRGRSKSRGRGKRRTSSHGSVSSGSSNTHSQSSHHHQHQHHHHSLSSPSRSTGPRLTAGFISTHNSLMEKKSYKDGSGTHHATRMKMVKNKESRRRGFTPQNSMEAEAQHELNSNSSALSQDEDDEKINKKKAEEDMTAEEIAILKAEKKTAAKQAQRKAAMVAKENNIKENARVRAAAPGWSLPALGELAIVGCTNFSVKGLKRLIANTPQLRRLDASDCRHLVPNVKHNEVSGFGASSSSAIGGGSSVHGSLSGAESVLSSSKGGGGSTLGGSTLGGTSSRGSSHSRRRRRKKKKKKGKVNWEELSEKLPYTRPAPLSRGLAPTPDANALAWRDSYIERYALEVRACRTVINCFRSFKFRRVYIVRHAAFVLTKFWKTFNIGMLKVMRLYKKVTLKRKLRRQFFLNLYSTLNAGRLLRRLARGCLARAQARLLRVKMTAAASKVQRMVRGYFDWLRYFKERAMLELEDIEDNPRFGFGLPVKHHHKPPYSEAKLLSRVQQIPIFSYEKPPVKLTCDGRVPFSDDMLASGTGFTGDMDVRRAFKAEPADIYSNGEKKPKKKQPLAMPERPRSFYT